MIPAPEIRRRAHGLTLLEVLAATLIFALVMTVLVGTSSTAVHRSGLSARRLEANLVADAVVVSTLVDGTLFVVKAGQTSRDAVARALQRLADVKARIFGAVLNDLDLEDRKYAEYYTYYHYGQERNERAAGSSAA